MDEESQTYSIAIAPDQTSMPNVEFKTFYANRSNDLYVSEDKLRNIFKEKKGLLHKKSFGDIAITYVPLLITLITLFTVDIQHIPLIKKWLSPDQWSLLVIILIMYFSIVMLRNFWMSIKYFNSSFEDKIICEIKNSAYQAKDK